MLIYTDEITSSFNSCAVCAPSQKLLLCAQIQRETESIENQKRNIITWNCNYNRAANDESSSTKWWILIIVQKATQEIKAAEPICGLCNTTSSKANLLPRACIHLLIKCLHHLWKNRPFFLPFLLSPACKIKGIHKHAFHTAICFILQN